MVDSAFAIALTAHVMLVSKELGGKILGWLPALEISRAEGTLLSITLGLGSFSFLITLAGLIGLLNPVMLMALLAGLTALFYGGIASTIRSLPHSLRIVPGSWRRASIWGRLAAVLAILIAGTAGLQALTPEFGYDPLVYHLQAPRLFLQAGRIYPEAGNWLADLPLSIQMLYTIGLSFSSDTFARLIHLAFGVILVSAVILFSKRLLPLTPSWLAGAVVLATPSLPIWASHAHADVAWAALEGLAYFSAISWANDRREGWLILSGAFSGFALATKPLAGMGVAAIGLFLLWHHRRDSAIVALRNLAAFALPAFALCSPWYVKNWLWFGHPLFPISIASNEPAVVERWELTRSYVLEGLSAGKGPLDLLVLPIRLYLEPTEPTFVDAPSLLLIFIAILPLSPAAPSRSALAMQAVRYAGFLATSHQARFLLPITVLASLPIANSMASGRFRRARPLLFGIALLCMVVTLIASLLRTAQTRPLRVIMGTESKAEFLTRNLEGFQTLMYISEHVAEEETVYLVGDSRRYYCPMQCDPEPDQFGWARLTAGGDAPIDRVTEQLARRGVTYLLVSHLDMAYLARHDPTGTIRRSYDLILNDLRPKCLEPVFSEEQFDLFRITCNQ